MRKNSLELPKLIAHRGYAVEAPQNSIPAFVEAGKLGFWAVETDVHKTKDGVLVCNHNNSVDEMYYGSGKIAEMTYRELATLRIKTEKDDVAYSREELMIPTFREYLEICRAYGALPFIETKTDDVEEVINLACEFFPEKDVIISNTGYTGAGGFELYFYPEVAMKIWDAIFEAGQEFGIKPIGLGARDTLRLEMGFCLYGNDITDETSPLEAGLGWITKFVEGKNFTNRAALEKQKAEGVSWKLVGFEMIDRGIPRHGYALLNEAGEPIGQVTSGTMSPMRKIGIGMGYVKTEYSKPGTEIYLDNRGRKLKAQVVKPPFRK